MEIIVDRKDCCGCGACYNVCSQNAISMVADLSGFLYPAINNQSCIDCGACVRSCPINYRDNNIVTVEKQKIYACHNNNVEEWKSSSSGGMFVLLADYVLKRGGYVVGAAYNTRLDVHHEIAENEDEIKRFKGSKYVQSEIGKVYAHINDLLRKDKYVLFTGTPCQVEGLKCYLHKDFEKLITCDIICSDVPSPRVFHDYISFLEKKYEKRVININMKDKTNGWPYAKTRIYFEDGESIFDTYDADLWINIWATELINRPSCENCRFTNYNRPGDITIGDCWSVYHKQNEFSHPNGISQLMINTDKGECIYEELKTRMTLMPITKEFAWQSKLEYPIKNNPLSELFWTDYEKLGFIKVVKKYGVYSPFNYNKQKFLQNLKHQLSKVYHLILKK